MEKKYRDAYALIELVPDGDTMSITSGTAVSLIDGLAYSTTEAKEIGRISNYLEDVFKVGPYIDELRAVQAIPVSVENYVILCEDDCVDFNLSEAVAVSQWYNYVIIYFGVIEIPEDKYTERASDRYCLTEEGLKYLDDKTIEEAAYECALNVIDIINSLTSENNTEVNQCAPVEREENSTMNNLFGNLGFGKIKDDRFKLSMNGIAVAKNYDRSEYVIYNKENNEFVDATNTLFDIKDALFLLPAVEVNVGDTVLHENKVYYIVDTRDEIKAVSYEDCTQTVLIPKSTMFGIKYFTKVFSMFGDNFATTGDLFSNPMMLMALMDGKNSDLTQLMLFNSMSNGDLGSNPMALAMLLKGDKSEESLSTIALMSMFNSGANPFVPKKKGKPANSEHKD